MRTLHAPLLCIAAVLAGQTLSAQCQSFRTQIVDVDSLSGDSLNLGVQFLNGEYFVTSTSDTTNGPWTVTVLDDQFNVLRSFPQPGISFGFGLRDGATDGSILYFGSEEGIRGFDANGNQVIPLPGGGDSSGLIRGRGLRQLGTYRALAFNPNGDGGNGSFFVGDFGDPILEIDQRGRVLNQFVNDDGAGGALWSAYGLAYDADRNTLWVNDAGDGETLLEIDAVAGDPTGRTLRTVQGAPGGLTLGPRGDIIALTQSTPDHIEGRFLITASPPARLVSQVNGTTFTDRRKTIDSSTSMLQFNLEGATNPALTPVGYFVNAAPESSVCADAFFFQGTYITVANFYTVTNFTSPSGPFFPLNSTNAAPIGLAVAGVLALLPDGLLRVQAAYVDNSLPTNLLPVRVTDEIFFDLYTAPLIGVTVRADGANSFNSDTTSGYWSIENTATDPNKAITSVVLDFAPELPDLIFDTDQGSMADRFDGGNSAMVNCLGTFRNGSDVATGLDYSVSAVSGCDPAAQTGFVGGGQVAAGSFQSLTFAFTGGSFLNGAVLEFDCDTDGGTGIANENDGLTVTVNFADGTSLTRVMREVAGSSSAVVRF